MPSPSQDNQSAEEFAISAAGLCKNFGPVRAVNGIDLNVPKGACFGLIGENGAGKTTFIKMMLGIAFPSEGTLTVLGHDPSVTKVRKRIGYLPERLTLSPAKNPVSLLKSIARLRGLPHIDNAEIEHTLDRVGLHPSAWKRSVGKFSKGMKQRTGLAASIIGKPELLVLDEPTDGIDPMGRAQIRDLIAEENKRGATVFLNSHLLAETERICDHVAILSKGRVVKTGALDVLQSTNLYEVRFLTDSLDDEKIRVLDSMGFYRNQNEHEPQSDNGFFALALENERELTPMLARVIDAGLLVKEVRPALTDLETLLKRAVIKGES